MTSMTTETPEVFHLPQLDRAPFKKAADEWVAHALEGVEDPAERFKVVAKLFTTAEAAAEKATAERDAAIYTLITSYKLRRGANLAGAVGVNRSGLQKIKDRQAKNPPAPVANADKALPRLAKKAMTHLMRLEAAREARNVAIQALLDLPGWSNAELARLIGRDPSLVSRMKHGKGHAA